RRVDRVASLSLLEKNGVLRQLVEQRTTIDESGETRSLGESEVSREAAEALYRTVLYERPAVCVQIGLAFGVSALAILTALEDLGQGRLISIDPWQGPSWGNAGLVAIERAGLEHRHELIENRSQLALPALARKGIEAGLGWINGWNTFDVVLMDFWYLD